MNFSIIIPTYNRVQHIQKGIESVIQQTYTDWELIIIDDGSTDNTKEVVESFSDERIKYIYQENSERSAARNNGIQHANGEWICFLDSDDYYLPNHLSTFHDFIIENNCAPSFLVSGGYYEKDGELLKKDLFEYNGNTHPSKYILDKTTITPISVCIHKICFKKHNFLEDYKKSYWEDTHLWIRLALEFPFFQISHFTNVLAEHPQRSVNSVVNILRVRDHINIIRHLFTYYAILLSPVLTKADKKNYIDRKYKMFLYQARQNKQLFVALQIWFKAIINQPSFYLMSELPKILVNKFGIGLHHGKQEI